MVRSAVLAVILGVCAGCAPVDQPLAAPVHAAALAHHDHIVSSDEGAMALFFEQTVTHGLEHLAVAAGTSLDASVDELHAALAPRLTSEGIDSELLTAFLVASQASYTVPAVVLPDVILVRIAEDDYRERLSATDCKVIASELGFDGVRNLGLWSVSPVGFHGDDALVYTSTGHRGTLHVLTRHGETWSMTKTIVLWTT